MVENRSLSLTVSLREQLKKDLSGVFFEYFPFQELASIKSDKSRDRIYSLENTLITMILTMCEEDKSLQTSVNILAKIHLKNKFVIEEKQLELDKQLASGVVFSTKGRPRTTLGKIPKSQLKEISSDTSGYANGRIRVPDEAMKVVYESSKHVEVRDELRFWHGMRVFITDGTYLQLQDSDEIRKEFPTKETGGYPRALLQGIVEQGTGVIFNYNLTSYKISELQSFASMIESIPSKSLILADDLYNCYAIFGLLKHRGIELIVPGKRQRNYEVIKELSKGDEIVLLRRALFSEWLNDSELSILKGIDTLKLRRIEYDDPTKEDSKLVLYTTILDERIDKSSIIVKYISRWDIELSIREIKTLMDVNVVRAKQVNTTRKEVASALTAYNYLRRLIAESTEDSAFSPEGDIIEKCYTYRKPILLDKLGRRYSKVSPGPKGYDKGRNTKA